MSKKSEKLRKEQIEKEREWKWKQKTFLISTLVAIAAMIPSYLFGKSSTNNYYGDIITYEMYDNAIIDDKMSVMETKEAYNINIGKSIALFAVEYCVGKPFVFGGTSLKEGTDASGLVLSVYKKFGIELPHSSYAVMKLGEEVNFAEIRDGDIVCYDGHVGIYVGENMVVHASNQRRGVVLDNMYYREPITIRRFDFAKAQENN